MCRFSVWSTSTVAIVFIILAACSCGYQASSQSGNEESRSNDPVIGQQDKQPPLTQYATDDFFAGAFLDLNAIVTSESYQNFPFDILLPTSVLFDRYPQSQVDQIVVLLKDGSDLDGDTVEPFEIAALARLKHKGEPTELLTSLAKYISPGSSEAGIQIDTIDVGERKCYRVPSGTFLNARRSLGKLQFFKKDSSVPTDGVSVGRFTAHRYIGGGRDGSAVFVFSGISNEDCESGNLLLELRPLVFRVGMLRNEYARGQVSLRQPGGKIVSDPVEFEAKGFMNQTIEFPRKLSGKNSNKTPMVIDLCDDLVVGGEVGVVIKCLDGNAYIGFNKESANVNPDTFEYVAFNQNDVLIAQSISTLSSMLNQREESRLSKELNQAEQEVVVFADSRSTDHTYSLLSFLETISLEEVLSYIPKDSFLVSGSADVGEAISARLELSSP